MYCYIINIYSHYSLVPDQNVVNPYTLWTDKKETASLFSHEKILQFLVEFKLRMLLFWSPEGQWEGCQGNQLDYYRLEDFSSTLQPLGQGRDWRRRRSLIISTLTNHFCILKLSSKSLSEEPWETLNFQTGLSPRLCPQPLFHLYDHF